MADATFRAGGLASGLDTNSIIDQLVKIEQRPMDLLRTRQAALRSQVSTLGDLASRLSSFAAAAKGLGQTGVVALSATTTSKAFSATTTTGGTAGRYTVEVQSLAAAAKARSQSFASEFSEVRGGNLGLSVMGTSYDITIVDGMTLKDLATTINQSGAPVNASVVSNGTQAFLSITNRDTGFPLTGTAGDALSIVETTTGGSGQTLSAAMVSTASNARVVVDGLTFDRTSNDFSDVVPGVRLSLQALSTAPEDVVTGYDQKGTQANLQKLVDAYNGIQRAVQKQLDVTAESNRTTSLAGDAVVRSMQQALQRVAATVVSSSGDVRTLADVGIKTERDGSWTLDATALERAVTRAPSSVDALFTRASDGLGTVITSLVDRYTNATDGLITTRSSGLGKNVRSMDDQLASLDARLNSYRTNLINQFSAMEKIVSGLKSMGTYLTQQFDAMSVNKS